MAITVTVPPYTWTELAGVWIYVHALEDPLLHRDLHRVTVHRDCDGRMWAEVAGNNAGVRMQSVRPDENDFADVDGGPL